MKRIAGMPALASLCSAALLFPIFAARGQEAAAKAESSTNQQTGPVALSLRRAIELALQNSKDIQIAKLQSSLSQHTAQITRAEFMPNLYAGSGAGYTFGIPETPGGRAPSVFSVTYTEQVLNEPLRGQAKEQQEQARAQRIQLEDARNSVISRTAMAYLELAKVRHALQILQQEESSAERILQVTQEREQEGLELPVRVTEAKLTKARIAQRRLQVEGREDELETFLHGQTGIPEEQSIEVSPEELPGEAEQEGANLVALAMVNNTDVRMAQSDVRAKEFRLTGEKRGYWPTVELVSIYSLLAKFNNYTEFFNHFQYNNYNAGVNVQVPLFSPRTKASIAVAQANLTAAQMTLTAKKSQVSTDVRQKTRRLREADAAKEIARLELQLAQQNLAVLQSQLDEGKTNLRDVEQARLNENDKWIAYLDANFARQQAQLELLRTAGQLDKVWQ